MQVVKPRFLVEVVASVAVGIDAADVVAVGDLVSVGVKLLMVTLSMIYTFYHNIAVRVK